MKMCRIYSVYIGIDGERPWSEVEEPVDQHYFQ